jgi:hydrogenase maturation factor
MMAETLLATLQARSIAAAAVGEILSAKEGYWMVDEGKRKPLVHPKVDPFWKAMAQATERKLR